MNGACGPDMHWDMTDEGALTITGTGKMTDAPWRDEDTAVKQLNLGEGITTICNDAFRGYGKLSDVTLPQSLVEIGDQAFSYTSLKVVRMPDNIEKIGKNAFSGCTDLEELHISPNIKVIPQGSFEDCSKLKEIILPEGLEEIGKDAFRDCCSLKKLTIPKSVEKIGEKFIEDSIGIRTVTNLSKIKIKLPCWCRDGAPFWNTNVYWYVNGKKAKTLKTGQTAHAKPRVYPIVYRLKGARVKGKMPKSYIYGTETKLPTNVIKKGYVFYGWEYYGNRVEDGWSLYSIKPTWGGKIRLTPGMVRFRLKNAGKHRVEVYVDLRNVGGDDAIQIRYSKSKVMTGAKILNIKPKERGLLTNEDAYGSVKTPALEKGTRYWFQFRGTYLGQEDEPKEYDVWSTKKNIVVK